MGNKDGFILSSSDEGVCVFLNMYGVVASCLHSILNEQLMKSLITVFLVALSAAPYSFFTQAFEMCPKTNNHAPKEDPGWHNGERMKQEEVDTLMAQKYPVT